MKKLLLFFLLLATACQTAPPPTEETPQPLTEAEKQAAKDLIQNIFDDLWGGLDSTKITKYQTDDFILLEHGEVWDNDRIKSYMREASKRTDRAKRINKMEFFSIEKYGEAIQMMYHNYGDFEKGDSIVAKRYWLESALAVPTDEGWKLKMMHSTRAPRQD